MTAPYFADDTLTLLLGKAQDVLPTLDAGSVDCVVTSPPYYGLRDYEGHPDQIGLEQTPAEYVAALGEVFAEVLRVLADDGTLWLNLGDSYSGKAGPQADQTINARRAGTGDQKRAAMGSASLIHKSDLPAKNLLGIPWRVAFALQDSGWILRNAIVWHKPNAMPESVQDRLSGRYEMLFLLAKSHRYWFNLDAIREPTTGSAGRTWRERKERGEPNRYGADGQAAVGTGWFAPNDKGRNPGDMWSIPTAPLPAAHFAAFPPDLPRRCIVAGCRPGGTVLDPFSGAGTTALAAQQLGRRAIGIDINATYHDIALRRMADAPLPLIEGSAS